MHPLLLATLATLVVAATHAMPRPPPIRAVTDIPMCKEPLSAVRCNLRSHYDCLKSVSTDHQCRLSGQYCLNGKAVLHKDDYLPRCQNAKNGDACFRKATVHGGTVMKCRYSHEQGCQPTIKMRVVCRTGPW